MTCEEFLRLLDEERLLADPAAAGHAASCPACGQALARWQAARRELLAMASETPPPFLHARIMAHLRAEAAERRQPRRLFSLRRTLLATAAVAVLASLAGYEVLRQRAAPAPPPLPTEGKSLPAASDRGPGVADEIARPATEKPAAIAPSAGGLRQRTRETAKERRQAIPPAPGRNQAVLGAPLEVRAHEGVAGRRESAPAPAMAQATVEAAPGNAPRPESIIASRDAAAGLATKPAAATKAEEAGSVPCLVRAVSTGQTLSIALPAPVAPAPGESWTITVARDGSTTIADARGVDVTHSLPDLRARLRTLALPPDSYLLARRSE